MEENLSLFEMEEQDQEQIRINRSGALDIVKMEFSGAESLSWQELFSGYDSLHAITYSSGISFVYRLLDLFTDAEIIFGCDEVISYSLQEIMAYQYKTIERMRETAGRMKLDLISRIEAETLEAHKSRDRAVMNLPEFTLGLTATPERADDKDILDIFKNTAYKLDIQTDVEIGGPAPVRCIRIYTTT